MRSDDRAASSRWRGLAAQALWVVDGGQGVRFGPLHHSARALRSPSPDGGGIGRNRLQ